MNDSFLLTAVCVDIKELQQDIAKLEAQILRKKEQLFTLVQVVAEIHPEIESPKP